MSALVPMSAAPVMTISEVERVALAIAKGGLFGSTDPNAVLTLCLLAQAEGQHPAVVFRDYHIIKGKPAKKADAMLRDFVSAGGRVEWHSLSDERADATFSHSGGGTVRIDWTIERACQAQLTTDMWRKYPRQMLRSRVISEGVRTVYPGATSGLYEVGEVQDIVAEQPAAPARQQEQLLPPSADPVLDALGGEKERTPPAAKVEGQRSKTAIYNDVKALDREMRGCGDLDSLDCLMAMPETKALINECAERFSHYLHGGDPAPPEFVGIFDLEAKMRAEFQFSAQAGELLDEMEAR